MVKKVNNYLISVVRNGKVVDLHYSDNLSDLRAIKLHETVERGHKDSDFNIYPLCGYNIDVKEEGVSGLSRNGNPPNRVKCIETGVVYDSVTACSRLTGIPEVSLRKSIRSGVLAYGYHFILIPPIRKVK